MDKSVNVFQISICKILFPYTVELSRKGKYKEAETSLRFMLTNDILPEYLLLLGKIYAQQGKYQEAIAEWKRVLDIDSENYEARAGILKAEELANGILPSQFKKLKIASLFLCFFLAMSAVLNFSLLGKKKEVVTQYELSLQNNQSLSIRYKKIEKQLQAVMEDIDVSEKYQDILAKFQNLQQKYGDLQVQTDNSLVTGLEKKVTDYFTQIRDFSGFTVAIKQKGGHVWAYGNLPTLHLKELVGKLLIGSEYVKSVDTTGIEISHKYSIEAGDDLGKIAKKLYGDVGRWEAIFKANQNKISNRHFIKPGIVLHIP